MQSMPVKYAKYVKKLLRLNETISTLEKRNAINCYPWYHSETRMLSAMAARIKSELKNKIPTENNKSKKTREGQKNKPQEKEKKQKEKHKPKYKDP